MEGGLFVLRLVRRAFRHGGESHRTLLPSVLGVANQGGRRGATREGGLAVTLIGSGKAGLGEMLRLSREENQESKSRISRLEQEKADAALAAADLRIELHLAEKDRKRLESTFDEVVEELEKRFDPRLDPGAYNAYLVALSLLRKARDEGGSK